MPSIKYRKKGETEWTTIAGGAGVSSFKGRYGAIQPQADDYAEFYPSREEMEAALSGGSSSAGTGTGTGDMSTSVYDPQGKATDVFQYVDDAVSNVGSGIEFDNEEPAEGDVWIDTDDDGESGTLVYSFNGRIGAVVPQSGDYTAEMVGAYTKEEVDDKLSNISGSGDSGTGSNVEALVSAHNTDTDAHTDIRDAVTTAETNAKAYADDKAAEVEAKIPTTAAEVGADESGAAEQALTNAKAYTDSVVANSDAATQIAAHNSDTAAHSDIRDAITAVETKIPTNWVNGSVTGAIQTAYSTASAAYAVSEGYDTVASAKFARASGAYTTAAATAQNVQGKYNISDTSSAHIVGNGSASARSNAHTLDWNGNAWFAGDVYVGSSSGVNKDDGSKKLATTEEVAAAVSSLYTYGSESLEAGVSALETGKLHFVYE